MQPLCYITRWRDGVSLTSNVDHYRHGALPNGVGGRHEDCVHSVFRVGVSHNLNCVVLRAVRSSAITKVPLVHCSIALCVCVCVCVCVCECWGGFRNNKIHLC